MIGNSKIQNILIYPTLRASHHIAQVDVPAQYQDYALFHGEEQLPWGSAKVKARLSMELGTDVKRDRKARQPPAWQPLSRPQAPVASPPTLTVPSISRPRLT